MPPENHDQFQETHVKTRRAVSGQRNVVYGADVERTRLEWNDESPDWVTESDSAAAEAACGCLIAGDVKPRFHRSGVMVCSSHYYFCSVCSAELLPLAVAVVDKRVYCGSCGEKAINEMLWTEYRHPGSVDRTLLAHLRMQKRELRSRRWRAAWNRMFGRRELPAMR